MPQGAGEKVSNCQGSSFNVQHTQREKEENSWRKEGGGTGRRVVVMEMWMPSGRRTGNIG